MRTRSEKTLRKKRRDNSKLGAVGNVETRKRMNLRSSSEKKKKRQGKRQLRWIRNFHPKLKH